MAAYRRALETLEAKRSEAQRLAAEVRRLGDECDRIWREEVVPAWEAYQRAADPPKAPGPAGRVWP